MRILRHKNRIAGPLLLVALVTVFALSALASQRVRTAGTPSSVVAAPQTKCENGFLHVQFEGQAGWFQTAKKCDARTPPPALDTSQAGASLTQAQLQALLDSYLSGNPQPQGKQVCCCQPGWRVYDDSTHRCSWGKLYNKDHPTK